MNIKIKLLLSCLVATAATSVVAATPTKDTTYGFKVSVCDFNEEGGFNFCTKRAYSSYKKLGSAKNINFNKKYVLINMKNALPDSATKYTHNYAVIDTSSKEVFPFPFTVYDEELSKNIKVSISSKTNTLCMPSSYKADGSKEISSYGGLNSKKKMCFEFAPGSVNNFISIPTYK